MIKRLVALLLVTMPALAQPGPAAVFFAFDGPGANRRLVDNAMHAALERPELTPAATRDARVLEVVLVGRVTRDTGADSTGFGFALGFYRGGERLGEAEEHCRTDRLSECADQLVSDITSANIIKR